VEVLLRAVALLELGVSPTAEEGLLRGVGMFLQVVQGKRNERRLLKLVPERVGICKTGSQGNRNAAFKCAFRLRYGNLPAKCTPHHRQLIKWDVLKYFVLSHGLPWELTVDDFAYTKTYMHESAHVHRRTHTCTYNCINTHTPLFLQPIRGASRQLSSSWQ
jgi:hypothetical protein